MGEKTQTFSRLPALLNRIDRFWILDNLDDHDLKNL